MIYLGLDIGQAADYTALVADDVRMEQVDTDERGAPVVDLLHRVRYAERLPLAMSYPDMVQRVIKITQTPAMADCKLVIDATGVGRPVVDMLRSARVPLFPVMITAGMKETFDTDTGFWHVPKRELVSKVQVVLGHGRLRFAKLPESETIKREFQNFKLKMTAKGNETYEAWRSGDHDDLVLAVALAVYFGERYRSNTTSSKTINPFVKLAKAGII